MLTVSPDPQFSESAHDWPSFALLDEPGVRSLNAFFCELTSTRELHNALRLISEQVRSFLAARFVAVMVFEDEGEERFAEATEIGSVSLPLSTGGRTIGQLTIYLDEAGKLSQSQARVMDVVCAIAAVTLDNARQLQRDRKRLRHAEAVASLIPSVVAARSVQDAARLVTTALRDKLHYDVVRLLGRQAGADEIKCLAVALRTGGASDLEQTCQELGIALRVMREGTPVLIGDVSSLDWHNCRTKPLALRSLICVPILRDHETIGVLDIGGRSPRAFDATDLETLTGLASTLSAVIGRLSPSKPEALKVRPEQEAHRADLMSLIVHDVRGPLSLVKGYASTLLRMGDAVDRDKRLRFLAGISDAADRMADMVDQLAQLSRLTSGHFQPKLQQIDLIRLAGEIVERARQQIGEHPITLELPGGALNVDADPDHISHAISYLLVNAASRSPSTGRIVIRVGRRNVLVENRCGHASASGTASQMERFGVVEVADEGPSIPPEETDKVFEKSYRVKTCDGRPRGLGLELYAAKKIVEAHGGPVWIESGLGKGTTFCFGVPLSVAGQGRL